MNLYQDFQRYSQAQLSHIDLHKSCISSVCSCHTSFLLIFLASSAVTHKCVRGCHLRWHMKTSTILLRFSVSLTHVCSLLPIFCISCSIFSGSFMSPGLRDTTPLRNPCSCSSLSCGTQSEFKKSAFQPRSLLESE